MKEKNLYRLAGVLVVLIIIWFITKPRQETINYDDIVQTLIFGVSKESIAEVEVYKQVAGKEVKMVLAKQEDKWHIPTYFDAKVKKYNIDRILDDMLEMTGKVATSDPKHQETFNVKDEQGIHIILKDEAQKPLANIIVGKKGEERSEGFVRFAGKEKIYRVDKNLLSSLSIYGRADTLTKFNQKSFVDLNAVKLDKKDFKVAALVKNGKQMVIEKIEKVQEAATGDDAQADTTKPKKKEYEWVLQKKDKQIKLDQKEVDKFFRDVTSIYAQEVVDNIAGGGNILTQLLGGGGSKSNPAKYGVNSLRNAIVFINEDSGEKLNIIFGKEYEKDKGYYLYPQYDGLVYKVNKSSFDKVFKWMDDLPTKLPKPEEKKKDASTS